MKMNPTVDDYEADLESCEKVYHLLRKRRKSNPVKIHEREIFKSNIVGESDETKVF